MGVLGTMEQERDEAAGSGRRGMVSSRRGLLLGAGMALGAAAAFGARGVAVDPTLIPPAGGLTPVPPRPRTVVYVGNDVERLHEFEAWLGHAVDGVQLHSGSADWEDWSGSIGWLARRWLPADRPAYWSIPLMAQGATLEEVAEGRFEERHRAAARTLAEGVAGPIHVRTAWEFNGDWMHWSAIGRPEAFVAAFRRFVGAFRAVSDRFLFEWCPNVGHYGLDSEDAYPGDDVVDVIGMDFYYDRRWMSADPEAAWQEMVERRTGLRWHQDFAASRGKPTAYSEWGVELETSAPYLRAAAAWFEAHPVLYQSYWNSDAAFRGKLSEGRLPEVGAAYREAFGPAAR
jgi:hypothetical protein